MWWPVLEAGKVSSGILPAFFMVFTKIGGYREWFNLYDELPFIMCAPRAGRVVKGMASMPTLLW
jgi:hypothetical protein